MKHNFEEEILDVQLGSFYPVSLGEYYHPRSYTGVIIYTKNRSIYFGIADEQSCCENYDFVVSGDYKAMIGQTLHSIKLEEDDTNPLVTAKVVTDSDKFEFTASNYHNGYYSHGVVFETRILEKAETWTL